MNHLRHMQHTFRKIFAGMHADVFELPDDDQVPISIGGSIIHEVGTVRMGDDPSNSVLYGFSQPHQVNNLFVAGIELGAVPTARISHKRVRYSQMPGHSGISQKAP